MYMCMYILYILQIHVQTFLKCSPVFHLIYIHLIFLALFLGISACLFKSDCHPKIFKVL